MSVGTLNLPNGTQMVIAAGGQPTMSQGNKGTMVKTDKAAAIMTMVDGAIVPEKKNGAGVYWKPLKHMPPFGKVFKSAKLASVAIQDR